MSQKCKLVMYHYVRPLKNSKFLGIKGLEKDGFTRQIKHFQDNFRFIGAGEILRSIQQQHTIPNNSIALTFDDGLKDHYEYVYPILRELKIPGLFFPPGKPIEEEIVLDVHKIHFILATCNDSKILINEIFDFVIENSKKFELESPEEYFKKFAKPNRFDTKEIIFIKRMLQRELPEVLRNELTDQLFKKFVSSDEKNFSRDLYISKDEINEMLESGMYFGSHTYSHEWLGHLDQKKLDIELEQSVNFHYTINNDKNSWIMCYPYGNFSQQVISKIKEQGFQAAITTEVGDAILEKSQSFQLSRYDTNDFPQ